MPIDAITIDKTRTSVEFRRIRDYLRIAQNLNYQRVAKILPTDTMEAKYIGLLEAQIIRDYGKEGGGIDFSDMSLFELTYINHMLKWGTKVPETFFNDLKNTGIIPGINIMSEAVGQATQLAAYTPQQLTVGALRQGESTTLSINGFSGKESYQLKCYDGKALFATNHPNHFKRPGAGTFSNLLSGAKSGVNPGFAPLGGPFKYDTATDTWIYDSDSDVSIEDGWINLWKVIAYVSTLVMPDGRTPRWLKPTTLVHSKQLQRNTDRILDAKNIAVKAGGGSTGGGSMDIEGSIKRLGFKDPVIFQELDSAPDLASNEQYTWYLFCEDDNAQSELGAINLGLREPWRVNIYSDMSGSGAPQFELGIEDAVAAIGKMRMFAGVGVPQYVFKIKAPTTG